MSKVSKFSVVFVALFVLVLGLATVQSANATPIEYITPTGSTIIGGGVVEAEAFFTLNAGSISLKLANLFQNPTDIAQLLNGISFDVSGASGSGTLTTANSGNASTISDGGSYTKGKSDSLTRWKAIESGNTISLTTLSGGAPNSLIIGPDSEDGFTQVGKYTNANSSITKKHNPSVLGSATFNITIPGVTDASTISNVKFLFGSGTDYITASKPPTSHVPIPAAAWLLGPGLVGLAGLRRKFKM